MTTGFGWGEFGQFDFGEAEWAKQVTYRALPYAWQQEDLNQNEDLRNFAQAYEKGLTELQRFARALPIQRDPLKAVASDETVDVALITATPDDDEVWGEVVIVEPQIGQDITEIGVGWTVLYPTAQGGRRYTVVRLRTRNDTGLAGDVPNQIWLQGPVTDFVIDPSPLVLTFQRPSMLAHLAADFAQLIDDEEPVRFQRSTVSNAVRLAAIKSNAKSYEIRGDTAGFNVVASGLYRVASVPENFESGTIFELPAGSGNFYSTVVPTIVRFDDIPLDIQYDDESEGTISLVDRYLMFPDESDDGLNGALAYAENILWGYFDTPPNEADTCIELVSVSAASVAVLSNVELAAATEVVLDMTPLQRSKLGYVTPGIFSLVQRDTREEFIISAEVEYDPLAGLNGQWTVLLDEGVMPPAGCYEIKYQGTRQELSCDWCRTNRLLIAIEPTQELIDSFDGDGEKVDAAQTRVLDKLLLLVPVHVKEVTVIETLRIPVSMNIQATLQVTL